MKTLPTIMALLISLLFTPTLLASSLDERPEQVIENIESWAAFAIVIGSLMTAWLLNYSAPKIRVIGTVLAASGCFALVIWFGVMLGTGIIDNPKPVATPLDSFKPTLLWIQMGIALLAGTVLVVVAIKQINSKEKLVLTQTNETHRYGMVSRVLHWTTAFLIISLIPLGIFTSMIPEDAWFRTEYYVIHKTIGVLAFVLLILRLIWNLFSTRPKLDPSLGKWERKLAHSVHLALYLMMLLMPITGFVMTSFHGFPTFFFTMEFAPLWEQSETATIIWGVVHKYLLPYLLYIILGSHILGALKHQFIDKHQNAFKRMIA